MVTKARHTRDRSGGAWRSAAPCRLEVRALPGADRRREDVRIEEDSRPWHSVERSERDGTGGVGAGSLPEINAVAVRVATVREPAVGVFLGVHVDLYPSPTQLVDHLVDHERSAPPKWSDPIGIPAKQWDMTPATTKTTRMKAEAVRLPSAPRTTLRCRPGRSS